MTLQVRRIVTGHDDFGRGIVVTDEVLMAVSRGIGDRIEGCEIWSTEAMPIDNSMKADAAQRADFVKKYNYVGSGEGTTIRIEVVHMKAGDVIVMRGVTHCWRNTGSVPAVTAFILLDAEPPEVDGKRLHTLFPA